MTFFCDFRKKGPRPKWTIYKHVSDNSKKCLSVGNSEILSVVCRPSSAVVVVVVCVLAPAYTSLCRELKYSPKVGYIIVVDPLWTGFLIFETVFLDRTATLPYVWKIHHKNEWHLCLVAHRFTKLSQNVYLVNTHILVYRQPDVTVSYGRPFDFIKFFGYFHTFLTTIHV